MDDLLKSYSRLHNFKQQNGLNIDTNGVSGYLLERKLARILTEELKSGGKQWSLQESQMQNVIDNKLIELSSSLIQRAWDIYLDKGADACFKFLHVK